MQTVAVIDYGMGNLRSVVRALQKVAPADCRIEVTDQQSLIREADRIVFPGQGAARACMAALEQHALTELVLQQAETKPFLGICMGLQVLLQQSRENNGVDCLGWFEGEVKGFRETEAFAEHQLKVPHMGWNQVTQCLRPHPLWHNIVDNSFFYFVHSYYVKPENNTIIAGTTQYGIEFASVLAKDNVFATQFHPEKSADNGLQLLRNFFSWDGTT